MSNHHIQLIVGLGNPGPDYAKTRHNAGAWFTQALIDKLGLNYKTETKFKSQVALYKDCRIIQPLTYMNESGYAVASLMQFYKLSVEQLLVVHDDLDLPIGCIKLKSGGGLGGHNGLRSITQQLGNNQEFNRLRIGIAHPGSAHQVTNFVLTPPPLSDKIEIDRAIEQALGFFPEILNLKNWPNIMNELHT